LIKSILIDCHLIKSILVDCHYDHFQSPQRTHDHSTTMIYGMILYYYLTSMINWS